MATRIINASLASVFTAALARRAALQGLLGFSLAQIARADADAKGKRKKRKGKKKNKNKKKGENPPPPPPPPPPSEEDVLFALLNDYRQANGLATLVRQSQLEAAARFHAEDMATHNYFGTTLSNGDTWGQNIEHHGYTGGGPWALCPAAGNETASATLEQWKASLGYNANLLSPGVRDIGVDRAYSATAQYGWYWVVALGGGSPD